MERGSPEVRGQLYSKKLSSKCATRPEVAEEKLVYKPISILGMCLSFPHVRNLSVVVYVVKKKQTAFGSPGGTYVEGESQADPCCQTTCQSDKGKARPTCDNQQVSLSYLLTFLKDIVFSQTSPAN